MRTGILHGMAALTACLLLASCAPADTADTSSGAAEGTSASSGSTTVRQTATVMQTQETSTMHTSTATARTTTANTTAARPASTGKTTAAPTEATGSSAATAAVSTVGRTTEAMLASMTLEQKVGQLFFVRCRPDSAVQDIRQYHLGGLILFARDTKEETKASLTAKIASYQQAAAVPLLIGVDEEGGKVNRVSLYKAFRETPFLSPQELYAQGGFALIERDAKEKALLLGSLGICVNLAPVCDVSVDAADYIYPRAFGRDAKQTAVFVRTVVRAMQANGVGAVLKHFPGYGSNPDTHTGSAVDNRPYSAFAASDFLPFQAGIEAGAGAVLVSHNVMACVDAQAPASLSPAVHEVLRGALGFGGVIMTDDLAMQAVSEYAGTQASAVLAIQAGNDLVVTTDFDRQIPAVLAAVREGRIPEARLDQSVRRVLEWKRALGLL